MTRTSLFIALHNVYTYDTHDYNAGNLQIMSLVSCFAKRDVLAPERLPCLSVFKSNDGWDFVWRLHVVLQLNCFRYQRR